MPRERIQHGKLYVEDASIPPTPIIGNDGQPIGVEAHALREYRPGEELPDGSKIEEMPSLDVQWRSDPGWVQVSIEAPAEWWKGFLAAVNDGQQSHFAAYTETLTREEINKMIRALRRARNAVYGSDE